MQPLADRIRPKNLGEFIGQEHLVGKHKPLRLMVEKGEVRSMVFWGPPGVGKTTLAGIVADALNAEFHHLSAVSAGKADVKKVVELARLHPERKTLLFLDEIHRFNKAQQDFLLPYVENGTIILIGATTENPSFSVISPLLSRCQVFVLNMLTETAMAEVVSRGAQALGVAVAADAADYLIRFANGDGRKVLNLMEATHELYKKITVDTLTNALQSKFLRYDKLGDEHYDTISAFIKSMRASDADAALYYLARMIDSGEDPLFIARRMVVFASEDVGMAAPTALVVANEVFRACETIGLPECQENLAHGAVYLALAKKDRSAYDGYFAALADVQAYGNLPIPMSIRNAPTKLMKKLGYGKGYEKYTNESLLPEQLKGKKYYTKKV